MSHLPGRWQKVEALFTAALAQPPEQRDAFVESASAGDPSLGREVLALLLAHGTSGAMDRLADEVIPLAAALRPVSLEGREIGHYRIEARVGGGGMGIVYRAQDLQLGRPVALKFLAAHLGTDATATERFRLEARTIAALEHPNICTLHEVGETDDGLRYLVMPLYEGRTVLDLLQDSPLPVGQAVGIAIQMLRGLAKAHGRGIIHRDIKPSNVLVTNDGVVKLLDFGVAKLADIALTGSGTAPLGTIAYMSPEQARGTPVDARTDVWSAGVVLYEMLAGERPYTNGLTAAIDAMRGAAAVPAPHALNPAISPALEAVVMKALARAPTDRHQSAAEFEKALSEVPGR